jgi:glutathione S-transferase
LPRSDYKSKLVDWSAAKPAWGEEESMRKLQSQGVHHITLVGADRQTSIDFWEGVLGMPFVFEQPNLDKASESHLYFDPGDGRLITIFTDEERKPDPSARRPIPAACTTSPSRLAGDLPPGGRAARRARDQAQRRQGPRLHGLDLLQDPLGLLIELASYRFEPPRGYTHADVLLLRRTARSACRARRLQHRRDPPRRRDRVWESCAIMQYLCNEHGMTQFYPAAPAQRAMVDSAMFYLIGTLYPLVSRATYGKLKFGQYPGEVGWSDADQATKDAASAAAADAIAEPLDVFHRFYMDGKPFIGGDRPSIADIRLAATLEFLAVIDYPLPDWAKLYMKAMEQALGDAYREPAEDVRGYIAYVRSN